MNPRISLAAAILAGFVPAVGSAQSATGTSTSESTGSSGQPAPVAATSTTASTPTATARSGHDVEDEAEEEDDDGWLWLDFAAGYSWINLVALDQSGLYPEPSTVTSSGYGFEAGLGVRFSIVRLGAKGSYARYDSFDAATAELSLQLVVPTPLIQPYLSTGFGYGWITNVTETNTSGVTRTVPIRGLAFDLGVGLDFAVSDSFQLGLGVEASLLNLQRQSVSDLGTVLNVDFTKPGNSLGLQIQGLLRGTLLF